MKVLDLFRPTVLCAFSRETLGEAAERMTFHAVGALAVYEQNAFVGILTERDIVRAISQSAAPGRASVDEHMTSDPVCVTCSWAPAAEPGGLPDRTPGKYPGRYREPRSGIPY